MSQIDSSEMSAVFEAHVIQLEGGALAYIHSHPQGKIELKYLRNHRVQNFKIG